MNQDAPPAARWARHQPDRSSRLHPSSSYGRSQHDYDAVPVNSRYLPPSTTPSFSSRPMPRAGPITEQALRNYYGGKTLPPSGPILPEALENYYVRTRNSSQHADNHHQHREPEINVFIPDGHEADTTNDQFIMEGSPTPVTSPYSDLLYTPKNSSPARTNVDANAYSNAHTNLPSNNDSIERILNSRSNSDFISNTNLRPFSSFLREKEEREAVSQFVDGNLAFRSQSGQVGRIPNSATSSFGLNTMLNSLERSHPNFHEEIIGAERASDRFDEMTD